MRPLTVINAIILGSCVAITVSLAAVLFVFFLLNDDYPRLRYEFGPLVSSFLVFLGMTGLSVLSFYSLVKIHPLRGWAQAGMWLGLAATTWYYWP